MVDAFRKAKAQKESEEYKKFLPIDYDAPPPAPLEDAKWTDSIGARVRTCTKFMLYACVLC